MIKYAKTLLLATPLLLSPLTFKLHSQNSSLSNVSPDSLNNITNESGVAVACTDDGVYIQKEGQKTFSKLNLSWDGSQGQALKPKFFISEKTITKIGSTSSNATLYYRLTFFVAIDAQGPNNTAGFAHVYQYKPTWNDPTKYWDGGSLTILSAPSAPTSNVTNLNNLTISIFDINAGSGAALYQEAISMVWVDSSYDAISLNGGWLTFNKADPTQMTIVPKASSPQDKAVYDTAEPEQKNYLVEHESKYSNLWITTSFFDDKNEFGRVTLANGNVYDLLKNDTDIFGLTWIYLSRSFNNLDYRSYLSINSVNTFDAKSESYLNAYCSNKDEVYFWGADPQSTFGKSNFSDQFLIFSRILKYYFNQASELTNNIPSLVNDQDVVDSTLGSTSFWGFKKFENLTGVIRTDSSHYVVSTKTSLEYTDYAGNVLESIKADNPTHLVSAGDGSLMYFENGSIVSTTTDDFINQNRNSNIEPWAVGLIIGLGAVAAVATGFTTFSIINGRKSRKLKQTSNK